MKVGPDIATVAALLGDPARANMLTALLAGQAEAKVLTVGNQAGTGAPPGMPHHVPNKLKAMNA